MGQNMLEMLHDAFKVGRVSSLCAFLSNMTGLIIKNKKTICTLSTMYVHVHDLAQNITHSG